MGSSDTLHVGDLPLHLDRDGLALLPGDVLAVVITGPDLLAIDDLPEAGAVLLGHVLALVVNLLVLLRPGLLAAGGESLVDGRWNGRRHVVGRPVCRAVGEELHLALQLRHQHALPVRLVLALLLQPGGADLQCLVDGLELAIVSEVSAEISVLLLFTRYGAEQGTDHQEYCKGRN